MNVFLIQPSISASCLELATLDPLRARKQLVECCQILASVEWARTGDCTLLKADGSRYGRSHPYHPCVVHAGASLLQFWLTVFVASNLASIYPDHACARSLIGWDRWKLSKRITTGNLVVVRRGHSHVYVDSLDEYSELMRPYFLAKVSNNV